MIEQALKEEPVAKTLDFDSVAARCAWTEATQVMVLLGYILQQQSDAAFEDYLAGLELEGSDPVPGATEDPQPPVKAVIPRCPECNGLPSGTCELVPGVALFVEVNEEDSALTYQGETKVDWDGQTTNRDRYNQIEFWCETCDLGWFAPYEGTIS